MDNDKQFTVDKTSGGFHLTLSGDLTLSTTAKLKKLLEPYLEKKESIKICLERVEGIDLGMFQLLQTFIWTRKQKHEDVSVEMHLPEDLQQLVDTCGIILRY